MPRFREESMTRQHPASVTIRPYEDWDEEAVLRLWNAVFPPLALHNDPSISLRQKRVFGDGLLWMAEESTRGIVGTIMAGYDGHRGWLYSVAVSADRRRQGIGETLLRAAEAKLKARGCLKINLQVRTSNEQVIAFYEKMGYSVELVISLGKRLYTDDSTE